MVGEKTGGREGGEERKILNQSNFFLRQEKLNIGCVHDSSIAELMRCVRSQFNNLVSGVCSECVCVCVCVQQVNIVCVCV